MECVREQLVPIVKMLETRHKPTAKQLSDVADTIMTKLSHEPTLSELQAEAWHVLVGYVNAAFKRRLVHVVRTVLVEPIWKRLSQDKFEFPQLPFEAVELAENQEFIRKRRIFTTIRRHFPVLSRAQGKRALLGHVYLAPE
jgi:hypothetical protein